MADFSESRTRATVNAFTLFAGSTVSAVAYNTYPRRKSAPISVLKEGKKQKCALRESNPGPPRSPQTSMGGGDFTTKPRALNVVGQHSSGILLHGKIAPGSTPTVHICTGKSPRGSTDTASLHSPLIALSRLRRPQSGMEPPLSFRESNPLGSGRVAEIAFTPEKPRRVVQTPMTCCQPAPALRHGSLTPRGPGDPRFTDPRHLILTRHRFCVVLLWAGRATRTTGASTARRGANMRGSIRGSAPAGS